MTQHTRPPRITSDERDLHLAVDPLVCSARECSVGTVRMSFFLYSVESDTMLFGIQL